MRKSTALFLLGMLAAFWTGHADALAGQKKGWLGVTVRELTPSLKEELKVGDREGLVISRVIEGSPAERAGLQEDDVIVEFDGKPVSKVRELVRLVGRTEPNTRVTLKIIRDGKEREIEVKIGRYRPGWPIPSVPDDWIWMWYPSRPRLGLEVADVNRDLAGYFDLKDDAGVLILEVEEGSPADDAGLRPGDVIVAVDRQSVEDTEELMDILQDYEDGDEITVEFIRQGKRRETTVELETFGYRFRPFFRGETAWPYFRKIYPGEEEVIIIAPGRRRGWARKIDLNDQFDRINELRAVLYKMKSL